MQTLLLFTSVFLLITRGENEIESNLNEKPENETITTNNNITQKYVKCLPNLTEDKKVEVQLVNDTELIKLLVTNTNITSKEIPANCVLVLFYSKNCPFSSMAAPHFNALPRAFPNLKMVAINAMAYHLFNTQNGIVGVPTIMLFHNGRPVAKFNESDYTLELFMKFVTKFTGVEAEEKSHVISADFAGPVVSVPNKDRDVLLIASWVFVLLCAGYYFTKSRFFKWIIETVQSNWRESGEDHVHVE